MKRKEAGNKTEGIICLSYEKGGLHSRDFKSLPAADETVVRYLNDRPAINALQSSDTSFRTAPPTEDEESRDENTKTSLSTATQDADLKELQLVESSASSVSTSSSHRLDILKQHQHDAKLEKLKERIRKQWVQPEELSSRGQHWEYVDHPVIVAASESTVTPKIRKVATAPPAPSYKGT